MVMTITMMVVMMMMMMTRLAWLLNTLNCLAATGLTCGVIICRERMAFYTKCIGREEIFHVDLDHLDHGVKTSYWDKGLFLSLPIYHPFR